MAVIKQHLFHILRIYSNTTHTYIYTMARDSVWFTQPNVYDRTIFEYNRSSLPKIRLLFYEYRRIVVSRSHFSLHNVQPFHFGFCCLLILLLLFSFFSFFVVVGCCCDAVKITQRHGIQEKQEIDRQIDKRHRARSCGHRQTNDDNNNEPRIFII